MAVCSGVRRGRLVVVILEGDAEFLDVEAIVSKSLGIAGGMREGEF